MSEHNNVAIVPAAASNADRNTAGDGLRQLAYAWIGLWSVASEDLGLLYRRCVSRGEQIVKAKVPVAQPGEKSPAPDIAPTSPKAATPKVIRPMSVFNAFGAVESYHIDLNVEELLPTKREFDALSERVEALASEVEFLVRQREQHD